MDVLGRGVLQSEQSLVITASMIRALCPRGLELTLLAKRTVFILSAQQRWTSHHTGNDGSSGVHSPLAADAACIDSVWREILELARVDRVKLGDFIGTLHRHCLLTQTCPPLVAFNELLRLASHHRDRGSADKLVELMHNNKMQVNAETWRRLSEHSNFTYYSGQLPLPRAGLRSGGGGGGAGGGKAGGGEV